VNGSGGRLRAAWYMDAGAQPRGGRVRLLWFVTVEVSFRVDPMRVWWAGRVPMVGGFWGRNDREIPVRGADSF
jgi:hypothetical protein